MRKRIAPQDRTAVDNPGQPSPWDLHDLGFSPFPLQDASKIPLASKLPRDENGKPCWAPFTTRQPTPEEMTNSFDGPDATRSYAIPTGARAGTVVVDCDNEDAYAWAQEHLAATPLQVRTAQGWHLYFRHPRQVDPATGKIRPVSNRASIETPDGKLKLDVRGDGGYVAAPGSLHEDGRTVYRANVKITRELLGSLPVFDPCWPAQPEPAPHQRPEPRRLDYDPDQKMRRLRAYVDAIPGESQGGRNNKAFEVARKISNDFDCPGPEGRAEFDAWCNRCTPPLATRERNTVWNSALKSGNQPVGSKLNIPAPGRDPGERLLVRRVTEALEAPQVESEQIPQAWGTPVPIESPEAPPLFPTEALPGWVADMVRAVADSYQVSPELPGLLSIPILSTALQGKIEVAASGDWREPVNTFAAIAQESGTRKSPVFSRMTEEIVRYEEELQVAARQRRTGLEARKKVLESDHRALEKDIQKTPAGERTEAQYQQLEALANQVEDLKNQINNGPPAELLADDITPEALAQKMATNGGQISILSPEADVFEHMAGRYTEKPSVNLFLKAYSGDSVRVDRVASQANQRPPIKIPRPLLTIGVTTQPHVLRGMVGHQGWKEAGLSARFLFGLPLDMVGSREICPPEIPQTVQRKYSAALRALLEIPRPERPFILSFTAKARDLFNSFRAWLEPQLGPKGALREVREWASKLPGHIVRVAGLFHVADHAIEGVQAWGRPIREEVMARALRLANPHQIRTAVAVFAMMGGDKTQQEARQLLAWIRKTERESFTVREAYRDNRNMFPRAETIDPSLSLLEEHGFIRRVDVPPPATGRPPSPRYLVNPAVLGEELPGQGDFWLLCPFVPRTDSEISTTTTENFSIPSRGPDKRTQPPEPGPADDISEFEIL